jgi:purine nucleosidase
LERILVDTDTAGDDTVALLLALKSPKIQVEAVTIVCGNVQVDQQVENALYTIEIAGKSGRVPVYPGCRTPLWRSWKTAEYVHGADGMGGSYFPEAKQRAETRHAVDAIVDLINAHPGEITLVCIAPLTNIAVALRKDPSIAQKVKQAYLMAGANQHLGNVTPAAEFNVWVDPDAAKIVYHSGLPITMVGWEICLKYAILEDDDWDRIEQLRTPEAEFFLKVNRFVRNFCVKHQRLTGSTHPDALTMAMVIDPSVVKRVQQRYVEVEITSELTRGMTVVDELGVLKRDPNIDVVYEVDAAKFKEMLFRMFSGDQP